MVSDGVSMKESLKDGEDEDTGRTLLVTSLWVMGDGILNRYKSLYMFLTFISILHLLKMPVTTDITTYILR